MCVVVVDVVSSHIDVTFVISAAMCEIMCALIYIYSYLLVPCGCCCLRTDECISENAMIARILALFKNHILHYFLHAFLSRRSRQPDFKSWCACVISVGYV